MVSNDSEISTPIWDAIIVGGGPAGSAAAITLARSGRSVLLLEKQIKVGFTLGESLPPAAIGVVEHFLGSVKTLGIANTLGITKTKGNVSCWQQEAPQTSDFFFTPKGFGLCIDRNNFDQELRDAAVELGVSVLYGAQLTGCRRSENYKRWDVEVSSKSSRQTYHTKYLLDCSGRRSVVAKALGVERQCHDSLFAYAQRFVSASGEDADAYTRIEASPEGWWYSNKLPVARTSNSTERLVVFHTDKNSLAAQQAGTLSGFLKLLAQSPHISSYLDKFAYTPIGKIKGAAAGSERLTQFSGEGWLAVGDAAQAYDPLSSQGIYKALNSASSAGQMVNYALAKSEQSLRSQNDDQFFLKRYAHEQEQLWADYVQQHKYYYSSQSRWLDQPFWNQRGSSTGVDSESQMVRGVL
jgi:flavin-dependent dehydrogenase